MSKVAEVKDDKPIPGQNFACISVITSNTVKNYDKDFPLLKIRGVYNTIEEAKQRCQELRGNDPLFNIYVAPIGKWVPWIDDPDKANDEEYAEKELNRIMKNYKDNRIKAKQYHEMRKNEMVQNAKNENEKRKQNNKKKKGKKNKKITNELITEENVKENLEGTKKEIEETQKEMDQVNENIKQESTDLSNQENKIEEINKELQNAQKLYEQMLNEN